MDCSTPGSSVSGIFLASILEWVSSILETISSSRASSQPRDQTCVSCVSCITGEFFTCWAIGEALIYNGAVINNTAMNICLQVFVWTCVLSCFGKTPRSGVTRLYDKPISNILRDHLLSKKTFTFPLPMYDDSNLSTYSLILLVVWLDYNHPSRYITRWSTPKSDWLYSLQPKMEKLYRISKNMTWSWLQLRSWAPYC